MFKGLKSKLEVEAKKLHASVQQCSEQFAQQIENIRSTSTETGSESGASITRRFLDSVGSSAGLQSAQDSLNLPVDNTVEEIEDLSGLDFSSRQRRLSCSSAQSTESSLSTLFQSVPGLSGTVLDSVDSDIETQDEFCSGIIKTATKDQISSMLSRLQARASYYKDKYRELMKKYNDVISENNKCRTVLAQTQDKALARIEKLKSEKRDLEIRLRETEEDRSKSSSDQKVRWYEEMLNKCKMEIAKERAKIKELGQQNEALSLKVTEDEIANEWKQRVEKVEKEWTERVNKNDADHALQLATTKAGMHAALDEKDKEIELWRSKCRALEIQDGKTNEHWKKKVDELQEVVQALEAEKGDMVVKLSAAKQQGVKAVLEEEEEKREKLIAEFSAKEQAMRLEFEAIVRECESLRDEEIQKLKSELVNARSARDSEDMFIEIGNLRKQLEDMYESRRKESEKHRSELTCLMKEHDEIIMSARQQQIIELEAISAKFQQAREEANDLRIKNEALEKQLEELEETYTLDKTQAEKPLQHKEEEFRGNSSLHPTAGLIKNENEVVELRCYNEVCESNEDLKRKLLEITVTAAEQASEAKQLEERLRAENTELREILESRNFELGRVQLCKDELEAELAVAQEFSAMYEHLRDKLEEAHKQRNDVDSVIASLKERAERAEKVLEVDHTLRDPLKGEIFGQEKSFEGRNEKEVVVSNAIASLTDISEHTASEMDTIDELQQLRAEVAHLNDVNALLASKLHLIELKAIDYSRNENAHLENVRLSEELNRNLEEFEIARNHRVALEKELSALKELFSAWKQNCNEAVTGQQAIQKETNYVVQLVRNGKQFENKSSETMDCTYAEHIDVCEASVNNWYEKNKDIAQLEKELAAAKTQEQEARALYLESENMCSQLKSRVNELVLQLDKVNGDLMDIRASAGCESISPEFQNGFETEVNSVSERLVNDELLVLKDRELEMAIAIKLELESKVSTLEMKLSDSKAKLEEATKVATMESERSSTTIQNLREELERQCAQLIKLQSELRHREEAVKNKELDQEELIIQFRAETDKLQHQHELSKTIYEEKLRFAESKITELKTSEEYATKSLEELKAKFVMIENKLHAMEKTREYEELKEERMRFDYEKPLEDLNSEFTEAHSRVNFDKAMEYGSEHVEAELCEIKKQCGIEVASQEESKNTAYDVKSNAQKELDKMKVAMENDITSVKAELLFKIDELQRALSERDRLVDKIVVEKERIEQKMVELQEMESEVKHQTSKDIDISQLLSDARQSAERRIVELESENRLLMEKNTELAKYKAESEARTKEDEKNMKELQDKIRFLLDASESESRKAEQKHDGESKKAIRELQREVRQLYTELNYKTEALDAANARLFELELKSLTPSEEAVVQEQIHRNEGVSSNHEVDEELELMRRKLNDSHKEMDELRDANSKLEQLLEQQRKMHHNSPAVINVSDGGLNESLGFSDPAEAEYLKNVLYQYMCSRENLGKEAVTLARVIGTVAKFSKSEMDNVIIREESRVAGWVGGTVSHVLTGR